MNNNETEGIAKLQHVLQSVYQWPKIMLESIVLFSMCYTQLLGVFYNEIALPLSKRLLTWNRTKCISNSEVQGVAFFTDNLMIWIEFPFGSVY